MELPPLQTKTTKVTARKSESARSRRPSIDSYFLAVPRTSIDCCREPTSLSDSCDKKKYQLRSERLSSNFYHISRNKNKNDEPTSSQNGIKPILKTNSGTVTLDSAISDKKQETKKHTGSGRFSYRLPVKVQIAPKKQVSFLDEADVCRCKSQCSHKNNTHLTKIRTCWRELCGFLSLSWRYVMT